MAYCEPGRLLMFALSTGPHCRAARKMLDALKAPYALLEVDLLSEPERARALAELAHVNPAQTFPTLLVGGRAAAGPLTDDLRRLAVRFVRGSGQGAGPAESFGPVAELPAAAKLHETLAPVQAAQGYVFNQDPSWTLKALAGILVNEARYGYGSCPGRLAVGRPEGDRAIICPCAFRAEDVAKYGHCHCRLYFSPRAPASRALPVPDRWLPPPGLRPGPKIGGP